MDKKTTLNELLGEFLTQTEKDLVVKFYQNDQAREAVKKVLLAGIYYNGTLARGIQPDPTKNFALWFVSSNPVATDEQLGRELRASYSGIMNLQEAFKYMDGLIEHKEEKESKNEAR